MWPYILLKRWNIGEDRYAEMELYCFSQVRLRHSRCLSLFLEQRPPRCSLLPAEVAAAAELGRDSLARSCGCQRQLPTAAASSSEQCVLREETLSIMESEFSSCCSKVTCPGPSKESLDSSGHEQNETCAHVLGSWKDRVQLLPHS